MPYQNPTVSIREMASRAELLDGNLSLTRDKHLGAKSEGRDCVIFLGQMTEEPIKSLVIENVGWPEYQRALAKFRSHCEKPTEVQCVTLAIDREYAAQRVESFSPGSGEEVRKLPRAGRYTVVVLLHGGFTVFAVGEDLVMGQLCLNDQP